MEIHESPPAFVSSTCYHRGMPFQVRRLQPPETALFRELRLQALAESPSSFAERYEDVVGRGIQDWERLCALHTLGPHVAFVAEVEGAPSGIAFGIIDRQERDSSRVGGMWVRPDRRGQGIATGLLQAVIQWARAQGRTRMGLWAPAHVPAALAVYQKAGFRLTGVEKLHRPGMLIMEMRLEGVR